MGTSTVRTALLTALVIAGALAAFPAPASAAPRVLVYDMDVAAEPAIQGPGLPVSIAVHVGFGGACCYFVYARDVQVEIIPSPGLNITGGSRSQHLASPGLEPGRVAAEPGGGLTWMSAAWQVTASSLGRFPATVRLTGLNDAGELLNYTASANITVVSGAAISSPILPHRPVVGRETVVMANVSTARGVRLVKLFLCGAGGSWTGLNMTDQGEGLYSATLPAVGSSRAYTYYMESLDSYNETFRTGNYTLEVKDPGNIAAVSGGATVAVTAGSLGGMAAMLHAGSRRKRALGQRGIFVVGGTGMETAVRERERTKDRQAALTAARRRLMLILVAVAVILLIVSLLAGQLEMVVRHTTNPGALVWP